MTPREIKPEDVRVGDRVLCEWDDASAEGRIKDTDVSDGAFKIAPIGWVPIPRRITLIARPLSPIPTDEGTVIRHKQTGVVYVRIPDDGARWVERATGWSPRGWTPTRDEFDVLVPEVLS